MKAYAGSMPENSARIQAVSNDTCRVSKTGATISKVRMSSCTILSLSDWLNGPYLRSRRTSIVKLQDLTTIRKIQTNTALL